MPEQAQPTTEDLAAQLDEVILSLQKLRRMSGAETLGVEGLSTQSNGCSTYSIHCGGEAAVARG